jgi:MarR family transcriptional regulator, 2-MHQ and catechol-resistance regulon repressor
MSRTVVLPVLRELVRTYQAFEAYSIAHIRTLGLTMPQFDIIATLGNTDGMTFTLLGEKTLITKGTLTGIVDRLENMALVERIDIPNDRRCKLVRLTVAGHALFDTVFEPHMTYLANVFGAVSEAERETLSQGLANLRHHLTLGLAKVEP